MLRKMVLIATVCFLQISFQAQQPATNSAARLKGLPVSFEENHGQVDSQIRYLAHMVGRGLVNRDLVISSLRRGFKPVLDTEIDKLTLRDVADLTDRIAGSVIKRKDGTSIKPEGAAREFRKGRIID